ncbi:unnamed protein product, partial [Larinioides sclopetarius]
MATAEMRDESIGTRFEMWFHSSRSGKPLLAATETILILSSGRHRKVIVKPPTTRLTFYRLSI